MKKKIGFAVASLAIACSLGLTACGGNSPTPPPQPQWVLDETKSTPATCGEAGTEIYVYSDGSGSEKSETVPATGNHTLGEDHVCSVCGYIDMSGMTKEDAIKEYGFYYEDKDNSKTYNAFDLVYFGSYPQELIASTQMYDALETIRSGIGKGLGMDGITKDDETYNALAEKQGILPTEDSAGDWTSYGYYAEGSVSDYMFYKDVELNGVKYRGVYMLAYRPVNGSDEAIGANSYISGDIEGGNGFSLQTVYWFEYTPIVWTVFDYKDGNLLLSSKSGLDSQPFQAAYLTSDTQIDGVNVNDWEASSVRKFLNEDFFNLAFTEEEQAMIPTVTLDNKTTGYVANGVENEYQINQNNTQDKIFLPSCADLKNANYGFTETITTMKAKSRAFTTYALIQGLRPSSEAFTMDNENAASYIIRSAGTAADTIAGISKTSVFQYDSVVSSTNSSIVPMLNLKVKK